MFMGKPYIVTATALADSLLLHVRRESVFRGLARDPQFARRMLAGMSRKLHSLVSDLESVTLKSGRERVIGYLLRQEGGGDAADSPYSCRCPSARRSSPRAST